RLAVPVAAGQPVVATVNVPGRVVPGRSAVAEAGLRPLAAAAEDRPVFAEGALVVAPADRAGVFRVHVAEVSRHRAPLCPADPRGTGTNTPPAAGRRRSTRPRQSGPR